MKNPKYRFLIDDIEVRAIYSGKFSKTVANDPDRVFKRSKLAEGFILIGSDYSRIEAETTQTIFNLKIYKRTISDPEALYFEGTFTKANCKFDHSKNKVTISGVETLDGYTKILGGLNKEFDLIKLEPEITQLNIMKRPIVQIYVAGDDVLSNFIGGTYWESDCRRELDHSVLTNTYKFNKSYEYNIIEVTGTENGEYDGVYVGSDSTGYANQTAPLRIRLRSTNSYTNWYELYNSVTGDIYYNTDMFTVPSTTTTITFHKMVQNAYIGSYSYLDFGGTYYDCSLASTGSDTQYAGDYGSVNGFLEDPMYRNGNNIHAMKNKDAGDGTRYLSMYHRTTNQELLRSRYYTNLDPRNGDINNIIFDMVVRNQGTGTKSSVQIYSRVLSDSTNSLGQGNFPIPEEDIMDKTNYKRVAPYQVTSIIQTVSLSVIPTEYGVAPNGQYYTFPNSTYVWFPISRSNWGMSSFWFRYTNTIIDSVNTSMTTTFLLKDAFNVGEVIRVLLKEIDPSISFLKDSSHSQFLFGISQDNQTNPLGFEQRYLAISPKSNIVHTAYTVPAQKAPMTLGQILDMLKYVYGCQWDVENGRLRIEHIKYYKNGKSYDSLPTTGLDLRNYGSYRNGYPYTKGQQEIEYEKNELVERFEYKWMDDVSFAFKGNPINVLSPIAEAGNVEKIELNKFTSDLDFIIANTGDVSLDGYGLIEYNNHNKSTEYWETTIKGQRYKLQNGKLSFLYLQPLLLIYDMPSWNIEVNGLATMALGVKRSKKHTVKFQTQDDYDYYKLIQTTEGLGQVEEMKINLQTRTHEIKLAYDSE